jgi:hypothetical protein
VKQRVEHLSLAAQRKRWVGRPLDWSRHERAVRNASRITEAPKQKG